MSRLHKAHIQRGQPGEDCWICYLDSGGLGLGPMGFGDTPAEAYENWRFDLVNDIGSHCDQADHSKARAMCRIQA